MALVPPGLLLGGTLLTYREWLDGPFSSFVAAVLLGAAATALGVRLAYMYLDRRPAAWLRLLPLLVATALALPLPLVHATRFLNRHAILRTQLTSAIEYGQAVEPTLTRDASLQLVANEVVVRSPPGSVGSLEVRQPEGPFGAWGLPRAFADGRSPRVVETLTWRGSIERYRSYFVLVDTEPLVVQTTGWGLLITLRPPGGKSQDHTVNLPQEEGQARTWTLRRHAGRVALVSGDAEVWSAPDPGPFRYLRLGETRGDQEHGGVFRLAELRFVRTLL
ncbi:MAG: hypothetical protein M3442_12630 [Chloroflexota bacterium]|nr:hypothetical protein [Chloroflexota bacterium]